VSFGAPHTEIHDIVYMYIYICRYWNVPDQLPRHYQRSPHMCCTMTLCQPATKKCVFFFNCKAVILPGVCFHSGCEQGTMLLNRNTSLCIVKYRPNTDVAHTEPCSIPAVPQTSRAASTILPRGQQLCLVYVLQNEQLKLIKVMPLLHMMFSWP
jgi:hypothetical protein